MVFPVPRPRPLTFVVTEYGELLYAMLLIRPLLGLEGNNHFSKFCILLQLFLSSLLACVCLTIFCTQMKMTRFYRHNMKQAFLCVCWLLCFPAATILMCKYFAADESVYSKLQSHLVSSQPATTTN